MKYSTWVLSGGIFLVLVAIFFGVRGVQSGNFEKRFGTAEIGDNGLLVKPLSMDGKEYLIPPRERFETGLTLDQRGAINTPIFDSIAEADRYLADEVPGLVVVNSNGSAKFYSYQILNWHEIVNDGDRVILSSTLTGNSGAYLRTVDGQALTFEHTNTVYNNAPIVTDKETGSEWLVGKNTAISGALIGKTLTQLPSTVMSWDNFKSLYPTGTALSTETGVVRDYTRHPYSTYDTAKTIYFPLNKMDDKRIGNAKWVVVGVRLGEEAVAFAKEIEKGFNVFNGLVDGTPIVATYDNETEVIHVFKAVIDGQTLTFEYDRPNNRITDKETGTRWSPTGIGISGKLQGTQLELIPTSEHFWFSWYAQNPTTTIGHLDAVDRTHVE